MKRVRYNNVPLAEDLALHLPQREEIFKRTPVEDGTPARKRKEIQPDTPRIDTRRLTLALFNAGLSLSEIAAQRQLAVSTVESHLAEFVGEEIPPEKLFTADELTEITALLRPLLSVERPAFKALYERSDGKFSYGKLRMAFLYLKKIHTTGQEVIQRENS
ncbi:MAG: helix-turn-helix domain-containing protein [Tannerella sp.]|nr:helix-turn-helix domain-containing protein [Tannerella sp.]